MSRSSCPGLLRRSAPAMPAGSQTRPRASRSAPSAAATLRYRRIAVRQSGSRLGVALGLSAAGVVYLDPAASRGRASSNRGVTLRGPPGLTLYMTARHRLAACTSVIAAVSTRSRAGSAGGAARPTTRPSFTSSTVSDSARPRRRSSGSGGSGSAPTSMSSCTPSGSPTRAMAARLAAFSTLPRSSRDLAEEYFVPAMMERREQQRRERRTVGRRRTPAPSQPPKRTPEQMELARMQRKRHRRADRSRRSCAPPTASASSKR